MIFCPTSTPGWLDEWDDWWTLTPKPIFLVPVPSWNLVGCAGVFCFGILREVWRRWTFFCQSDFLEKGVKGTYKTKANLYRCNSFQYDEGRHDNPDWWKRRSTLKKKGGLMQVPQSIFRWHRDGGLTFHISLKIPVRQVHQSMPFWQNSLAFPSSLATWWHTCWSPWAARHEDLIGLFMIKKLKPRSVVVIYGFYDAINYSPGNQHILFQGSFEDDVPFPKVGYVSSLEAMYRPPFFSTWGFDWIHG